MAGNKPTNSTGIRKYAFFIKERVSDKWEDLAFALDFDTPAMRNIKHRNHDDKSRCRDMLGEWEQRKGDAATMGVLMEALTDIELKGVVDGLKKKFPKLKKKLKPQPGPREREAAAVRVKKRTPHRSSGVTSNINQTPFSDVQNTLTKGKKAANITRKTLTSPGPKLKKRRHDTSSSESDDDLSQPKSQPKKPRHRSRRASPGPSRVIRRQHPFNLVMKTSRMSVCQGCKGPLGNVPLVIQHYDNFPYFNKTRQSMTPKFRNGYFHASFSCIKPKYQDFDRHEVVVKPSTLYYLKKEPVQVKHCANRGIDLKVPSLM